MSWHAMSSSSSRTRGGGEKIRPPSKPPSGANWIHEIDTTAIRLMARRDPVGIRLLTRRGNDWSSRFPLIVEAVQPPR